MRRSKAAIARGVVALVATIVAASLALPTAAAAPTIDVAVSGASDRSSPTVFEGASVSGSIYVFATPSEPASEVRFFIDDVAMSSAPFKIEKNAPFDLAGTASNGGANPFDTTSLANGARTLTVRAVLSAGGSIVTHTAFVVANAAPPPPVGDEVLVSGFSDRSSPSVLEGASASGSVFVFALPGAPVKEVRFFLDDATMSGTPFKVEKNAPYDLAGTASSGRAIPLDTNSLADGPHTLTVRSVRSGSGSTVVHASFAVANGTPPAEPPFDQVHLAWIGDPSSTLAVVWRTFAVSTPSTLEYRVTGTTTWVPAAGQLRPSGTTGTLHQVDLTGLASDTEYEYRVRGGGGTWSPTFEAHTAPAPGPADFDVVYVADTGIAGRLDGLTTGTTQVLGEIDALDPLLVLGGGDYAYFNTDTRYANVDAAIDAWFNQVQPIASGAPFMPAYGNHEALLSESVGDWTPRFPTPNGWNGRRAYSFDVGDAHFVAVYAVSNSNPIDGAQFAWLDQDLAAARARGMRWIVPYLHVAPFADGSSHPSNTALRAQLGPVFEQYDVDVVLTSHDQSYERTFPLTDVGGSNLPTTTALDCYGTDEGTTYVKVSPGGKLSNLNGDFSGFTTSPQPSWTAVRDDTMHHFGRLRFSAGGVLRVEAFGVTGNGATPVLTDAFEYRIGGCDAGPSLAFNPASVALVADDADPTPTTSVELTASDGATNKVAVTDNAGWLSVPATAAPGTIPLAVDAAGLAPGIHHATVLATSPSHGVASLAVTLTVETTTSEQLLVSASSNRANAQPLPGAAVNGVVYIFLPDADDASQVRFYLDDPAMTGAPRKVEKTAPWDFAGTNPNDTAIGFNASSLPTGAHSITALVITPQGNRILGATFQVL